MMELAKTAFVLSGGGAGGAFQIGVLQRLAEEGIVPQAIYGTSVGALNAAGIAYMGLDDLTEFWLSIKGRGDIFSRNWLAYLGLAEGLYSHKPLKSIIDSKIKGTPSLKAVVSNVSMFSGEVHYVSSEAPIDVFKKHLLASACVPFWTDLVDGQWADGGIREHTPVMAPIRDGFDNIYVIACNPYPRGVRKESWIGGWPKNLKSGLRAIDLLENEVFLSDIEQSHAYSVSVKVFSPRPERILDTFEFDPGLIRKAIVQGRLAYDTQK